MLVEFVDSLVTWYQSKISAYDKQLWEKSVEETVLKSIDNVPRKEAKFKPDLIDVDLVRGSTYPKTKPKHGFFGTTKRGILRVLFFPLYVPWWTQQTSGRFVAVLLVLYVLQAVTIGIYLTDSGVTQEYVRNSSLLGDAVPNNVTEHRITESKLSSAHLIVPLIMLAVLGLIHSHIMATHEGHHHRKHHRPASLRSKKKKKRYRSSRTSSQQQLDDCSDGGTVRKRKLFFKDDSQGGDDSPRHSSIDPEETNNSDSAVDNRWEGDDPHRVCSQPQISSSSQSTGQLGGLPQIRLSVPPSPAPCETIGADGLDSLKDLTSNMFINKPLPIRPDNFPEGFQNLKAVHQASSSGESGTETPPNSPSKDTKRYNKKLNRCESELHSSEMEWDEEINSGDMTTDSSSACSSGSSDTEPSDILSAQRANTVLSNLASSTDRVWCIIWEKEEAKKVDLSVLDLGWTIINKVDHVVEVSDYALLGLILSCLVASLPLIFRLYLYRQQLSQLVLLDSVLLLFGENWGQVVVILNGIIQRFCTSLCFFFLLAVAEKTFKQRLMYAKHFCYLTSSRRAKKYNMPHFRLNKVRNIKTWLSLRSYLKKRGPQRSVDAIVSSAFLLAIVTLSLMCLELLHDSETFFDHLGNWELVLWSLALALYLLRFMTVGTKINRKYRNFSVLITEQINLYLHLEKKPNKKDELQLANNVLKLAEALLKELENPFKISGLSVNPILYNITKLVILSAFSAVLTEILGFKLKLYKIKLV